MDKAKRVREANEGILGTGSAMASASARGSTSKSGGSMENQNVFDMLRRREVNPGDKARRER